MYAQPKIHKPGNKMRPIVSTINSPTYNVAKWVVKYLNSIDKYDSLSVKNSFEFVEQLKDIRIADDEVMVSFDVESLFPSVPQDKAIACLSEWFRANDLADGVKNELIKLTKLCIDHSYFTFNNNIYKQKDGLSMGNPVSPMLADVFMSKLELTVIKNHPDVFKVWKRVVDDVFCIMKRSKIDEALNILNAQDESIRFTVEIEKDGCLPFLDVMVIRQNGSLEFDVYRKPTHTDLYINNKSYNPPPHKLAAFNSMIRRMIKFPLSKDRKSNEQAKIMSIANKNGFKFDDISRLIKLHEYKEKVKQTTTLNRIEEKNNRLIPFPYHKKKNTKFSIMLKFFKNLDVN